MRKNDAIVLIKNTILEVLSDAKIDLNQENNISLIGSESQLDSMQLVELCLSLEDKASEMGFVFDWTSKNAMSKSSSIFLSVESLADEFIKQKSTQ